MSSQIPMTHDNTVHPQRRSARIKDWDYSNPGAYFVTVVTKDRQCLFGQIEHDQMTLNDVGNIVAQTWEWLQDQYPYVDLDAFVIMPNDIHGIVLLQDAEDGDRITEPAQRMKRADASHRDDSNNDAACRDTSCRNAACRDASRSVRTDATSADVDTEGPVANQQAASRLNAPRKPLGRLIGAFKTVSTKRVNQLAGTPGKTMWQGRFHDHIIRKEESLDALRKYIAENPIKWSEDRENPDVHRGRRRTTN